MTSNADVRLSIFDDPVWQNIRKNQGGPGRQDHRDSRRWDYADTLQGTKKCYVSIMSV